MKRCILSVLLLAVIPASCVSPAWRLSGPEAILDELRSITVRGDIDRLISHIAPGIVSMYSPSFGMMSKGSSFRYFPGRCGQAIA
jgi:hypothetical protein